jgi:hypothetical protein
MGYPRFRARAIALNLIASAFRRGVQVAFVIGVQ